jgi:hypothetical protein
MIPLPDSQLLDLKEKAEAVIQAALHGDMLSAMEQWKGCCPPQLIITLVDEIVELRKNTERLKELLERSYGCVSPIPEGAAVQYVGVHAVRWNTSLVPTHGFLEWDRESIDAALQAGGKCD